MLGLISCKIFINDLLLFIKHAELANFDDDDKTIYAEKNDINELIKKGK